MDWEHELFLCCYNTSYTPTLDGAREQGLMKITNCVLRDFGEGDMHEAQFNLGDEYNAFAALIIWVSWFLNIIC